MQWLAIHHILRVGDVYKRQLYEWTDPATGWNGTYRGKPVKEGVYFCLVKAKGADLSLIHISSNW